MCTITLLCNANTSIIKHKYLCVRDYLGGRGSTFNCWIAQVAPQRVAKLVKIAIYDCSIVQYSCSRSICHNLVQISQSFGLNFLGAQWAYKCRSVAILIVPALVLLPPSNCTRMFAHSEINSTREKNSRKYGTYQCCKIKMSMTYHRHGFKAHLGIKHIF